MDKETPLVSHWAAVKSVVTWSGSVDKENSLVSCWVAVKSVVTWRESVRSSDVSLPVLDGLDVMDCS